MVTQHLTDVEIQEYALDHGTEGNPTDHLQSCAICKARVEDYRLLFAGMKEQEVPAFDFDLAALVQAQLPVPRAPTRRHMEDYLPVLVALFAGISLGYIFRHRLAIVFGTVAPLAVYLIITSVITVLIFLCADMYKDYQKKMNLLDPA